MYLDTTLHFAIILTPRSKVMYNNIIVFVIFIIINVPVIVAFY